jgi:hypothetical protein
VQRKSGHLAHPAIERLITRRQRLQREDLAASLRSNGNAVGNRRTSELIQRSDFEAIAGQVAILSILSQ